MDSATNGENVHRFINKTPSLWSEGAKRPSSALFKDKNGVSVDFEAGRSRDEIKNKFKNFFGENACRGVACISVKFCESLPTRVIPKPSPNNPHHAEIHDINTVSLTKTKMDLLAGNCEVYFY